MIDFLRGYILTMETVLVILAGSGLGISAAALTGAALNRLNVTAGLRQKPVPPVPLAVRRFMISGEKADDLPPWLQRWLSETIYRAKKAGVKISPRRYLVLMLFGALAGFTLGVVVLNNIPAACLIGLAAYLIPDRLIVGRLQAIKFKKIEQLGAAVRVFAAEFSDTPQVPRALAATARRIPDPLGSVLRHAEREFVAGKRPDEVCMYLMKELDFEYGRMFIQLLRIAWDDAAVKPLFSRLAARISGVQSLIKKNTAGLSYNRMLGLLVNAMILPVVLVMCYLIPETGFFLTQHPAGRFLVCLGFVSVLGGLVLDKLLSEVES